MSQSYKVGVKTRGSPKKWTYNGLRFSVLDDGQAYASHLQQRWPDVLSTVVEETGDRPNAVYPVPSDRYLVPRLVIVPEEVVQ